MTGACKGSTRKNVTLALLLIFALVMIGCHPAEEPGYQEEFFGIMWSDSNSITESVAVTFSGERSVNGEFIGNIIISKGEKVFFSWENVKIVWLPEKEREYYICPVDADTDADNDGVVDWASCGTSCYAMMFADQQWNEFTIALKQSVHEGFSMIGYDTAITVPAATLEEALIITEKLSQDTHMEFSIGNRLNDLS